MTETKNVDKAPVYFENGKVIYRASSVGFCERALTAIRLGYDPAPPPDWLLEKFKEGHQLEDNILGRFTVDQDIKLKDQQREVEVQGTINLQPPPTSPENTTKIDILIRGHIDALSEDGRIVVDAKAFSQGSMDSWKSKGWEGYPHYSAQMTVYMEATGAEEGCLAIYNKDTGEMHYAWVDGTPGDMGQIIDKLVRIERQASEGRIQDSCPNGQMWPCPVYYIHDDDEDEDKETIELTTSEKETVKEAAREYLEAKKVEKEAKDKKKEARERIKDILSTHDDVSDDVTVVADGYEINRNRYSYKTMRKKERQKAIEDGLDLEPYMAEVNRERINIKDIFEEATK